MHVRLDDADTPRTYMRGGAPRFPPGPMFVDVVLLFSTNIRCCQVDRRVGVEVLSVLIGGRIWSYRDRLDAYDVPGVSHRPSAGVNKVYYRVLQQVVVTDECQRLRVLIIFPTCLRTWRYVCAS